MASLLQQASQSSQSDAEVSSPQVGGRLGGVFDEDPRRWRLMAEIFTTLGLSLEIATAFNPSAFVVLAGSGNFFKAVGKGLGRPCFRIIQTHFALQNNVGDISAKEEVSGGNCIDWSCKLSCAGSPDLPAKAFVL